MSSPPRHEGQVFGAHLRHIRIEFGLTQGQLAARARSNLQFISKLERGLTTPTIGMLIRLAKALNCSVCDLVEVFDRTPRLLPKSRKD